LLNEAFRDTLISYMLVVYLPMHPNVM